MMTSSLPRQINCVTLRTCYGMAYHQEVDLTAGGSLVSETSPLQGWRHCQGRSCALASPVSHPHTGRPRNEMRSARVRRAGAPPRHPAPVRRTINAPSSRLTAATRRARWSYLRIGWSRYPEGRRRRSSRLAAARPIQKKRITSPDRVHPEPALAAIWRQTSQIRSRCAAGYSAFGAAGNRSQAVN